MVLDVQEAIAHARELVDAGDHKVAAQYLSEALEACTKESEVAEVRAVAEQGLASAGWFGKRRWQEILRTADARLPGTQAVGL